MDISAQHRSTETNFSAGRTGARSVVFPTVAAALVAAVWLGSDVRVAAAAEDFAALARAASDRFTPITDEQLAAARSDLQQRASELERHVESQGPDGRDWLDYLGWQAFAEQLASDALPERRPLRATFRQLNRDEVGLELAPFRRVSDALVHYFDLVGIAQVDDQAAAYATELDALATELEQYREQPSPALGATIGLRLSSIAGLGQAPELIAAVRQEFARPNALVRVSADLLSAAVDPIDRTEPVTDRILGVSIRSTAHTTGTTTLRTVPADDRALIEITAVGHTESDNVGRKGPAVIRSTANTDFTAVTQVELTDAAFRSHATQVDATTHSNIHSIRKQGGGFGKRFVSRIGWKKARQKHSRADAIASDHAEDRVARSVRDETADALEDAWQRYQDGYRTPLERRGELPEHIRFSTTDSALEFEVAQANRAQLAATGGPPESPAGNDIVLRIHESAVNNYTASVLGGVTISESQPDEGTKADANLPDWISDAWKERMDEKAGQAPDADFKPWSLTFHGDRPIEVAFVDGKVQLTIHIAQLKSGREFTRWDVTGTFKPEPTDGGVTLHRQELDAYPVGRDLRPLTERSAAQAAERKNLLDELTRRSDEGRGFPQTIEIKPLEPSGDLAKVGPLTVGDFNTAGGWLTVTWNRQ